MVYHTPQGCSTPGKPVLSVKCQSKRPMADLLMLVQA